MQTTALKKAALDFGADLVGVAPVPRLARLPEKNNIALVAPEAKTIIAIGKRILRGSLRGTEEGTNFNKSFWMHWLEEQFLSRTIQSVATLLEDAGFEALPMLGLQHGSGAFEPDTNAFARAAGLGDVGRHGLFMTPEFGPRQRIAFIATNAEFEPDAVIENRLCDGCDACEKACPLMDGAPSFPPHTRCRGCENGAALNDGKVERFAAACARACVCATEGKLTKKFNSPFRHREAWSRK